MKHLLLSKGRKIVIAEIEMCLIMGCCPRPR